MSKPKDLGPQGKPGKPNVAAPKKSGMPADKAAPMNKSFRGKQPGATGANDSKKAK